ncbi:MAG: DNA-binding response regulator [Chloroflexi bacterium]|nr:MAG: DNA-binding response regulator [Chloroflexota bacterium]
MTNQPIKILIVEDHTIVRQGLRLLLESQPDITVVAEAENGREAILAAQKYKPDVILMDISMPDMNGLEATETIHKIHPQTKILILTMHKSDEYFFRALEVGASGYLLKKVATEELIQAVRTVAAGHAYLYPSLANRLVEDFRQRKHSSQVTSGLAALSEREKEVFLLLAQGKTNQQIADELVISPSTVQTYRTRIMEKLSLESTVDLIRYAIRHGLIEP